MIQDIDGKIATATANKDSHLKAANHWGKVEARLGRLKAGYIQSGKLSTGDRLVDWVTMTNGHGDDLSARIEIYRQADEKIAAHPGEPVMITMATMEPMGHGGPGHVFAEIPHVVILAGKLEVERSALIFDFEKQQCLLPTGGLCYSIDELHNTTKLHHCPTIDRGDSLTLCLPHHKEMICDLMPFTYEGGPKIELVVGAQEAYQFFGREGPLNTDYRFLNLCLTVGYEFTEVEFPDTHKLMIEEVGKLDHELELLLAERDVLLVKEKHQSSDQSLHGSNLNKIRLQELRDNLANNLKQVTTKSARLDSLGYASLLVAKKARSAIYEAEVVITDK